jgi:D-alanine-D-alanine ligase
MSESLRELARDLAGTSVAVLYGGVSSEREISLESGNAVIASLEQSGASVEAVDVGQQVLGQILGMGQVDMVFNALHGGAGEDGRIQAALELAGKPYTGSGVLASSIGMNKLRTKQVWEACGLPTPDSIFLEGDPDPEHENWERVIARLGEKVIVKPVNEGSSIGMGIAANATEFSAILAEARQYDTRILVERFVEGGEYTVGVLAGQALPVIKLETSNRFYDYEAKYQSDETRYICPCGLNPEAESQMKKLALEAFSAIGCEGWGRVDLMRDAQGNDLLLEVNTVPGLTSHSLVPMAAAALDISFDELISIILHGKQQEAMGDQAA